MRASPLFYTHFGMRRTRDPAHPFTIEPTPELCRHGVLRAAVVASAVDLAGSLETRAVAGNDTALTLDLSVRVPARRCPKLATTRSFTRRAGRQLVTAALELDADGQAWAFGETTFLRVPPRDPHAPPPERLPDDLEPLPLALPLASAAGIEIADASRGRIELPLRENLISATGVLQGSVFGLLAECAAEALAEHELREPRVVTELDLRFLSAGRRGPITSLAAWVGAPADGMIRVELRDAGESNRLIASALARTARAPA